MSDDTIDRAVREAAVALGRYHGEEAAFLRAQAVVVVERLAEAGLLAPAPFIEETETDRVVGWAGDVLIENSRRRYATGWLPADDVIDRSEGGKAATHE